ncbi:hypothetical protein [Methylacidimicrobium cyclopophantes]|nr:hypothetical protein [Methylacidimicrobium cyclopophantes]
MASADVRADLGKTIGFTLSPWQGGFLGLGPDRSEKRQKAGFPSNLDRYPKKEHGQEKLMIDSLKVDRFAANHRFLRVYAAPSIFHASDLQEFRHDAKRIATSVEKICSAVEAVALSGASDPARQIRAHRVAEKSDKLCREAAPRPLFCLPF